MRHKNAILILSAVALVVILFIWTYPRRAAILSVPPAQRDQAQGLVIDNGRELIDINRADINLLLSLPGVGQAMAERLIEGRPYDSIEDLSNAKGFGEKTIDTLRPFVVAGEP